VQSILKAHNKALPKRKRAKRFWRCFEAIGPNALWSVDICHLYTLKKNGFNLYLITILDDHSRYVVGSSVFEQATVIEVVDVLRNAVTKYGVPQTIVCDNGSQFTCTEFRRICQSIGLLIDYAPKNYPRYKGKIERFFRTTREEMKPGENVAQARHFHGCWILHYNHSRIHSSVVDNCQKEHPPLFRVMYGLTKIFLFLRLSMCYNIYTHGLKGECKVQKKLIGFIFLCFILCPIIGGTQQPRKRVELLDFTVRPEGVVWTEITAMPMARSAMATGVVNRCIYVIGGGEITADGTWQALSKVECYEPEVDMWKRESDIPTPRWGCSASVVNGQIFVIGGANPSGPQFFSMVEVYDPVTDTWTTRKTMPTARETHASGVVKGKIYVIGGYDGEEALSTVECYNPVTDMWIAKADMPTPRVEPSASVIHGKIYVIGGWNTDWHHALSTVEVYDAVTDTWSAKAGMPTPRASLSRIR